MIVRLKSNKLESLVGEDFLNLVGHLEIVYVVCFTVSRGIIPLIMIAFKRTNNNNNNNNTPNLHGLHG